MEYNFTLRLDKTIPCLLSGNGGRTMRCLYFGDEAFENDYDEDIDFEEEDFEDLEDFEEEDNFLDEDEEED